MANSPRRSLLKKGKNKKNKGAKAEQATESASPGPSYTSDDTARAGSGAPVLAAGGIKHVDPTYQTSESGEYDDKMNQILKRRSHDRLPSIKGSVNLWEMEHVGLLVNYACIGFLNGLLPAIVYPFFKLYLNMEGFQVNAAGAIIMLPWSYKTFFGVLTDHYPILGYRRKSYILIGWFVCFLALMVLAYGPREEPYYLPGEIQRTKTVALRVVQNRDAPSAGARYLVELMAVCLGYVITDVACDGIMVELAQHEFIEVRGNVQSTIYIIRFTGNLVGGIVAAFFFNGIEYGGTFDWSIHYETIFFACAVLTLFSCVCTVFFLIEEQYFAEQDVHPFWEMWRIVKQRAIWQMMAFHFLNAFFNNFGFSGFSAIQEYWVVVSPLNNSISTCFSTFLFVAATCLMKMFFLNTSWRGIMAACTVLVVVVYVVVGVVVTYDIYRNEWFYLGGPQLAVLPDGMRHVIAGFVTTEIAEHGFEGATYSLLTTVHNLATPFAAAVANLVDSRFDVSDEDIMTDSKYVRDQVLICLGISWIMQFAGLFTLALLPNQKLEAQELKYRGSSSSVAGVLALSTLAVALVFSTTINILSIFSSTACLPIAGGRGCT
ncbi:hypothetical protein ATCC90586_008999 [Pythium insidiosum]|nr:hypothetical protein ATCC90586_008999 [Pythium insidiosum]